MGYQYTWFKSIGTNDSKEARLDRALCTVPWQDMFPQATLQTLVAPMSDHMPIMLQLEQNNWRSPYTSFRFNNSWLLESDLAHVVKENWSYYPSNNIVTKLSYCIEDIKSWSKSNHPHFHSRIQQLRVRIEESRNLLAESEGSQLLELQKELANLLLQEESYWRQRSKVFWLRDGDTNSKFFHAQATARCKKNTITKLRHPNGCFILVFGCQTLITFEPFKPVISYFFLGREKVSKTLENRGPGVVFATGRC